MSHGLVRTNLITRRSAGRLTASAAALGILGAGWQPETARAASPTPNTAHTVLLFQPFFGDFGPSGAVPIFDQALRPFLDSHPSLQIKYYLEYPNGEDGLVSSMLAGTAPDIIEFWTSAGLIEGGYLLDLAPYIRSSNADLSVLPPTQVQFFARNSHQYALPVTIEWIASMVNLTMFDDLGLKYPSESWDYQEADGVYRALAKPNSDASKNQWGGWFRVRYGGAPQAMYFYQWGGTVVDPNNASRCVVDSSQCVACTGYMADLVTKGVCGVSGDAGSDLGGAPFFKGQVGIAMISDWRLVAGVRAMAASSYKVDFRPLPRGPVAGAGYGSPAYYAIPSTTKNPDAAWELLQWITFQPDWARLMMRLYLLQPPQLAMSDEYLRTIGEVAPPLRGKNIAAFTHWTNHIINPVFASEDSQAESILGQYCAKVWKASLSAEEGLRQAAQGINALEAAAGATSAKVKTEESAVTAALQQATGAAGASAFPPPPKAGAGTAAAQAAADSVSVKAGTWSLVGTGSGVNGSQDSMTFACLPWTGKTGTFTCRIASVSAVSGGAVNDGAKIGLMARGDLSTAAAMASVELALGRGVHAASRPIPAGSLVDQRAGATPGLLGATGLLQKSSSKQANYLMKPLWLRLVQDLNRWTAFSSLDGVTWRHAGTVMVIEAAGTWVGLFVSPHASKRPDRLQAVVDHVSFQPTAFYQLG